MSLNPEHKNMRPAEKRRSIEDIYPLSPLQHGLLFHSIYDVESSVYGIQLSCSLEGNLDIDAFAEAWRCVLDAHPVLRTSFIWEGLDEPLQIVRRQVDLPLTFQIWDKLSPHEQTVRWQEQLAKDREQGFDLSQAPLTRLMVFRCSDNHHYFSWTYHHISLDGWCLSQILGDVFAAYSALLRGSAVIPFIFRRPYREYIAWLKAQDMDAAESYWREQLNGFAFPTPIGIAGKGVFDRAPRSSFEECAIFLSESDTDMLHAFTKRYQLTLSTVVQGAWALLLSRYSGERDIVFGVTVSGRPAELVGVESMVGLFINSLPLRVVIDPQVSVLDWLKRLLEQNLEMRRYEYTPLVDIQSWSQIPRGEELFMSLLSFENYPTDRALMDLTGDLTVNNVRFSEQPHYPLSAIVSPGKRFQINILFDDERFKENEITRMLGHLEALLRNIIASPLARLGSLSMLTDAERRQQLGEWNDTCVDLPQYEVIHALFGEQVEKNPEAVAVCCGEQQLSYRELSEWSNRLAHYLQSKGVRPDARVGICIDRRPEMIVGILGILRAGGAYVPIDPNSPIERIVNLLDDCGATLLVTSKLIAESLPRQIIETICFDRDGMDIAKQPVSDMSILCHSDNTAYVIYTSGSTGKPKGVVVSHRNLVHSTLARFAYYQQTVAGFLLLSPIAFDSSVAGIFWTLSQGGRLCIPSEEQYRDPFALAKLVVAHGITHLLCLPSLYDLLLDWAASGQLSSLHAAIVAGEECSTALEKKHRSSLPAVKFYNEYGPTEGTVWSTAYLIESECTSTSVPIGRSIGRVRLYVLDDCGNLSPVGVPGELHIAGEGLARGYLNRPDLTAERFIPNPFAKGERLYRSGDRVRSREDGSIEFLGRVDQQVKIRGVRIELREIEALMHEYPTLREAAIIAQEETTGGKRLVGYVVCKDRNDFDIEDLRSFLEKKLPSYMVPSMFVLLDRLPLTPNGKLDRRRLPKAAAAPRAERRFIPPTTPEEKILAKHWSEVLRTEQVGVTDRFFDLGGDSIQAMQVISRARQNGINITLRQLFEHQTIASLIQLAGSGSKMPEELEVLNGDVPLTPIQCWFFDRNPPNPHYWNQSILLEAKMPLDPALLELTLKHLVVHHDALRLRFAKEGQQWRQYYADEETHEVFHQEDFSEIPTSDLPRAIETRATWWQRQLNITSGPVLQAVLFHFGRQRGVRLLIIIHHLVVDGVSWRVLMEDMESVYWQAVHRKRIIELPTKTTSFKKWSERLKEYSETGILRKEVEYWLGLPWDRVKSLPIDYHHGSNTEKTSETITVSLNDEVTQQLLHVAAKAYGTGMNEVLLTALVSALMIWSGNEVILIELEGHGREDLFVDVDLSRTVGWFTSSFPVVFDMSNRNTPIAVLKSVLAQFHRIPKKGLSYGVARFLSPHDSIDTQCAKHPKAQVFFNYLGHIDSSSAEPPLLALAQESVGTTYDANGTRVGELYVSAQIRAGKLEVAWNYGGARYRRSTIEALADTQLKTLTELIRHCPEDAYSQIEISLQQPHETVAPLGGTFFDWDTEMVLDPQIVPGSGFMHINRNACFLTGATGFVGAFLLYELLKKTNAKIYCLVRAETTADAIAKLHAQMDQYKIWNPFAIKRIIPVCGDLETPLFGLSETEFRELADCVDTIYHIGAMTDLIRPYSALKQANVFGTTEVLRLACTGAIKPVHYASTLSVFSHHYGNGITKITEEDVPVPDSSLTMGYAQSKLVAESLIRSAGARGCPIVIYRLGTVTGHSLSGAWNMGDFYSRLLRTCVELSKVPETDELIDMTPVDYVCKSIVYLSSETDSFGRCFHLHNPNPIRIDSFVGLLKEIGYPVMQVSYNHWVDEMVEVVGRSPSHILYPLISYFEKRDSDAHAQPNKIIQRFSCDDTLDVLSRSGIACPPINNHLLKCYFSYISNITN